MKNFDNLHAGDIIESKEDGRMGVVLYDFYATGERILCFTSKNSIYPASEFIPEYWEKVVRT